MSILMCKWAEPDPEPEPEPEVEDDLHDSDIQPTRTRRKASTSSESKDVTPTKSSDSTRTKADKTPSTKSSPKSDKKVSPEKEKSGLFVNIKWADSEDTDEQNNQESPDRSHNKSSNGNKSQKDSKSRKEDKDSEVNPDSIKEEIITELVKKEPSVEIEEKKETKNNLFLSVKWAENNDGAESSSEEEKEQEAALPKFFNAIPADVFEYTSGKCASVCESEVKDTAIKEEVKSPDVEDKKVGSILSIRWATDPGNEVESEPESPPRSPTPKSPSPEPDSDLIPRPSSRSSSNLDKKEKRKIPKCGPKSAMKKYRTDSEDIAEKASTDKCLDKANKRKRAVIGPKSAVKRIKEEHSVLEPNGFLEMEGREGDTIDAPRTRRNRLPSQKLKESATAIKKTTKATKKKSTGRSNPSLQKQSFLKEGEYSERKKRAARPSTFNNTFNTDPNSPYLYTTGRKGPMVRLECDIDDDDVESIEDHSGDYVPNDDNSAGDSDEHEQSITTRKQVRKRSTRNSQSHQPPKIRKIKEDPDSINTEDCGLSLGAAYSLADEQQSDILAVASEPFVQLDVMEGYHLPDIQQDDPLFDPLSMASTAHVCLKKKANFIWPKLDPLFLITTDFQLPRYFESLIRAKVRPTAEISPMVKVSSIDSSITITKVVEEKKSDGVRRSSRKKAGRYSFKSLVDDDEIVAVDDSYTTPTKQTRSNGRSGGTASSSLAATLSRISGSNITITPVKSSSPSPNSKYKSQFKTRVVPLDRKDFPWLPKDWMVNGMVCDDGSVSHSFISPGGVALNSQAAVVQFLSSTDKKVKTTAKTAPKSSSTAKRKRQPSSLPAAAPASKSGGSAANTRSKPEVLKVVKPTVSSKSKATAAAKRKNPDIVYCDDSDDEKQEQKIDPYQVVCKTGDYTCPICYTKFNLNQTYGRHVVKKNCKVKAAPPKLVPNAKAPWILEEEELPEPTKSSHDDDEPEVIEANVTRAALQYIQVHKCTPRDDSYVDISSVPSLKTLARRSHVTGGLYQAPISVKEGLEYYHSIVWKDNNEKTFFDDLCSKTKMSICSTLNDYEELCREPLKVALFLERKIAASREKFGTRSAKTKHWVQKYEKFLKLPVHDIYLSLKDHKFKVIEYGEQGKTKPLCLNCYNMNCVGCAVTKPPGTGLVKKISVPIRVKPSASANEPAKGLSSMSKLTRCGNCSGCMQPNCRKCAACTDMKRYGGEGKLRQACKKRICVGTPKPVSKPAMLPPVGIQSDSTSVITLDGSGKETSATSKYSRTPSKSINSSPKAHTSSNVAVPSFNQARSSVTLTTSTNLTRPTNNTTKSGATTPGKAIRSFLGESSSVSASGSSPKTMDRFDALFNTPPKKKESPKAQEPSVIIDLDASLSPPSERNAISSGGSVSKESYPCTVCKRPFPTRIQMLAHRSVTHNKDNIMASVSRSGPVVLHRGNK